MEYTLIKFILFDETTKICVCKSIKRINLYKLVHCPPCWNSTARLARHARLDLLDWLDWLDKVERVESSRVESSRAKWNLGL